MRLSSPNDGGDASLGDIGPRSHCATEDHRLPGDSWRPFLLVWVALAAFPPTCLAQATFTATAGMPVRMEIVASCTVSATDLNFGAYSPKTQGAVQGQSAIDLVCGGPVTAEVSLDAGSGAGASTTNRRMEQETGTDRLEYDLFQDPARTIHWGMRSGTDTLEMQMTGATVTIPVYGQIPGGQRAREGTYSDIITVRVLY
jgi:spore coat protein U-like protein